MLSILHNGRIYLSQAIVWVKYDFDVEQEHEGGGEVGAPMNASTLEIGFVDGTALKITGNEATQQVQQLEEHFGIDLQ